MLASWVRCGRQANDRRRAEQDQRIKDDDVKEEEKAAAAADSENPSLLVTVNFRLTESCSLLFADSIDFVMYLTVQ